MSTKGSSGAATLTPSVQKSEKEKEEKRKKEEEKEEEKEEKEEEEEKTGNTYGESVLRIADFEQQRFSLREITPAMPSWNKAERVLQQDTGTHYLARCLHAIAADGDDTPVMYLLQRDMSLPRHDDTPHIAIALAQRLQAAAGHPPSHIYALYPDGERHHLWHSVTPESIESALQDMEIPEQAAVILPLPSQTPFEQWRRRAGEAHREYDGLADICRKRRLRLLVWITISRTQGYRLLTEGSRFIPVPWPDVWMDCQNEPFLSDLEVRKKLHDHFIRALDESDYKEGLLFRAVDSFHTSDTGQSPHDIRESFLEIIEDPAAFCTSEEKKEDIVNRCFGLTGDADPIGMALLYSMAFAQGLPDAQLRALVRHLLPEGNVTDRYYYDAMSDRERAWHDEKRQEYQASRDIQNPSDEGPPAMPQVSWERMFANTADTRRRALEIETGPERQAVLGRSWGAFDLPDYLCIHAPTAVSVLTERLFARFEALLEETYWHHSHVLKLLAKLHMYMGRDLDESRLRAFLEILTDRRCVAYTDTSRLHGDSINDMQQLREIMFGSTLCGYLDCCATFCHESHPVASHATEVRKRFLDSLFVRLPAALYLKTGCLFISLNRSHYLESVYDAFLRTMDNLGYGLTVALLRQHFIHHMRGGFSNYYSHNSHERCYWLFSFLASPEEGHPDRLYRAVRGYLIDLAVNFDIRPVLSGYDDMAPPIFSRLALLPDNLQPYHEDARKVMALFLSRDVTFHLHFAGYPFVQIEARLEDVLFILLNGCMWPADSSSARLLKYTTSTLCTKYDVYGVTQMGEAAERLRTALGVPSGATSGERENLLRLYSLFHGAAILLHWRCRYFGLGPLKKGSPEAKQLKRLLEYAIHCVSRERALEIVRDLYTISDVLSDELASFSDAHDMPKASEVFRQKAYIAEKIANFMQEKIREVCNEHA